MAERPGRFETSLPYGIQLPNRTCGERQLKYTRIGRYPLIGNNLDTIEACYIEHEYRSIRKTSNRILCAPRGIERMKSENIVPGLQPSLVKNFVPIDIAVGAGA